MTTAYRYGRYCFDCDAELTKDPIFVRGKDELICDECFGRDNNINIVEEIH